MQMSAMPKRVIVLVSFANMAGAQIAALRAARGLRERGFEPSVHFFYQQVPVDSPYHPYDVLLPTARPGVSGYLKIVGRLWSLLRREKPDAVLTFLPLANVLGQAMAALAGVRRRIVSHRMPANTARPVLRALDTLWARLGIYTRAIAVSNGVLASIRHYPAGLLARTSVVHNGLLDWKPSPLSRDEARARFGIAPEAFLVVAVGRFLEQKHYPFMLRMIREVPEAQLLIAGDGKLRPQIEKLIGELGLGDRVRLLGNLARGEVPDLFRAGDVFIQTSTFEGQSNAVLEALRAEIPIVVHDVPEQRETLADEAGRVAGALVPLEDIPAWTEAIRRLGRPGPAREEALAASAARAHVFTYEAMMDGFERALRAER